MYERACMATPKDKYFEKMLKTLVDHNDCHNAPLSNDKLQQAVSKVMAETEEEERNNNNVTMVTFCHSLATTNTQRKNSEIPNEWRTASGFLAETIKGYKRLTLHSTINDSEYYSSDKDYAESDPKKDLLVATHTSDGKKNKATDTGTINRSSPQKLLINRTIPTIIPPINPQIADGVAAGRGNAHAGQTIASKVIVTDAARSGARAFQDPAAVNRKDTDETIPQDGNTSRIPPRLNSPFIIGGGISFYPSRTGGHDSFIPSRPIGPVEVRNAQIFHTSINGNSAKNGDPTPTFSKIIGREISNNSSADVYLCCWVNLTRDVVLTKIPNFMNMGL